MPEQKRKRNNVPSYTTEEVLSILDGVIRGNIKKVEGNTFQGLKNYFEKTNIRNKVYYAQFLSLNNVHGIRNENAGPVLNVFRKLKNNVLEHDNRQKRQRQEETNFENAAFNAETELVKAISEQENKNRRAAAEQAAINKQLANNRAMAERLQALEEQVVLQPNNNAINALARELEGQELPVNGVVQPIQRQELGEGKIAPAAIYALKGIKSIMRSTVGGVVGLTGRFLSFSGPNIMIAINAVLARVRLIIDTYKTSGIPRHVKNYTFSAIQIIRNMLKKVEGNRRNQINTIIERMEVDINAIPQEREDRSIFEQGRIAADAIKMKYGANNIKQYMNVVIQLVESTNKLNFNKRATNAQCTLPVIHTTYDSEKASAAAALVAFNELIQKKPEKFDIWIQKNSTTGVCVAGSVEEINSFVAEHGDGYLPMTADGTINIPANLNTLLANYVKNKLKATPDMDQNTFERSFENCVVELFMPLKSAYNVQPQNYSKIYTKVDSFLKYFGYGNIEATLNEIGSNLKPPRHIPSSTMIAGDIEIPWDGILLEEANFGSPNYSYMNVKNF